MSGQSGGENDECPPFAKVMVDFFKDSLEVSFDIIQHMIHDNLAILHQISEVRNDKWIGDVKKALGKADEACTIALYALSFEGLVELIDEPDIIKNHGGNLRVAVQELLYVHEDLKKLQNEYDEKLVKDVVEASSIASDKLEGMVELMIGNIAINAGMLKNYGYVRR